MHPASLACLASLASAGLADAVSLARAACERQPWLVALSCSAAARQKCSRQRSKSAAHCGQAQRGGAGSLWPKAESRDAVPQFAATISKDWLALWKVGMQGLGLETPCLWKSGDPAGGADPTALKHESRERLWSLGNDCKVKCWDVNATSSGPTLAVQLKTSSWVTGMQLWPGPGVMVCSHSSGILFFDMKAGKLIRNQYTKTSVGGVSVLHGESPILFAGIGNELMQYDTRLWRDGNDYKPKCVGSWTLRSRITALHCTETRKGHVLVGCGCENGHLAAFDTS